MGGLQKIRVLHLVHQYLPEHIGGTELYTQALARELAAHGHDVSVFYPRGGERVGMERRIEDGVQIWAARTGSDSPTRRFLATFGDRALETNFEDVLGEVRPEIVHVEHLMGLPATFIDALRRQRLPFIITLWDFWWICANAQLLTNYDQQICNGPRAYLNCARCATTRAGKPGLWPARLPLAGLLAWRNRLLRQVMLDASRLIAPTEFVRRWYQEHGVSAEKLIVLPPGLEEHRTVPRSSLQGRPLRAAYIGGLSWQKGVHVLVEAFGRLTERAELWIAGDETADPAYVSRLRANSGPGVRFLGRLSRDQVWETLSQVDVVAVPTLWYETFSFIVSEAFAAGIPVIASSLGPLADRVRHGEDGFLAPPGDVDAWHAALQQIIDQPQRLADLRANVRPGPDMQQHVRQIASSTGIGLLFPANFPRRTTSVVDRGRRSGTRS